MLTHKSNKLFIYFGDASDGISKQLHCNPTQGDLVDIQPFKSISQKMDLTRLSALNQTHGIQGALVEQKDFNFNRDGDYLITRKSGVGLGVLTADCVPLILHDAKHNAIAAIHAGWRGAVTGIVPQAIEHMCVAFGTSACDLQFFVGPSAKSCCYQVKEDFVSGISSEFLARVVSEKDGAWYFDNVRLLSLQAQDLGIPLDQMHLQYNFCTMCDHRFYSHRRQGARAGRQITIAYLRHQ